MTVRNFYYNFKNKLGLYELIKQLDTTRLWRIRVDEYDEKTRLQEEKYHAMLGDIARQMQHLSKTLDVDSWKRLCVAQFAADSIENDVPRLSDYWRGKKVTLMPSIDGRSLVALGQQTRDFPKYVAAGFITWLYAYGDNNDVAWSEPAEEFDARYAA